MCVIGMCIFCYHNNNSNNNIMIWNGLFIICYAITTTGIILSTKTNYNGLWPLINY